MKNYLNFENEVKELETKLDALKDPYNSEGISEVNTNEMAAFEEKINVSLLISVASSIEFRSSIFLLGVVNSF